jgi:Na+-transporting NADH:ubiquinone oxidoreductase subunit NqrF
MIFRHVEDIDKPVYYVCGSPAMVGAIQNMLLTELSIAAERVKVEDFPGY